jgi:hypothetical protein
MNATDDELKEAASNDAFFTASRTDTNLAKVMLPAGAPPSSADGTPVRWMSPKHPHDQSFYGTTIADATRAGMKQSPLFREIVHHLVNVSLRSRLKRAQNAITMIKMKLVEMTQERLGAAESPDRFEGCPPRPDFQKQPASPVTHNNLSDDDQ